MYTTLFTLCNFFKLSTIIGRLQFEVNFRVSYKSRIFHQKNAGKFILYIYVAYIYTNVVYDLKLYSLNRISYSPSTATNLDIHVWLKLAVSFQHISFYYT